ncbi:MAG: arsenate reductase [Hyphomicrobiaceae bacterium]|nr:arsenate reductase [Hyphomicrobiaceae bacterium]
MPVVVYGIPNCDTVRTARAWLDARGIDYIFHDYKRSAITSGKLQSWCEAVGWEVVINRAGTTFRKLPDRIRAGLDRTKAISLMCEQPSMIKRPIVEHPGGVLVGFSTEQWERVLASPR